MDSRRDFLKKAAMLAAGGGFLGAFPSAIQKAFAIDPAPGTTWRDAEHVVILMQENRSFDHAYGTLRGVRGFNDPRAVTLPDGNPVWLQTNAAGETYAPFRLNITDTKITWMGSLPHSRPSQVLARNGGRHDHWLQAKASSHKAYAHMPLTMGHYTREDIPFYYALADAFTICDQAFCSALTSTTPNRLYLWSGTIRAESSMQSLAHITNAQASHDAEVNWKTFPERLEGLGISWRVYQNELYLHTGLTKEEDAWLGNFGCNPLEYFSQFNVRFAQSYRRHLEQTEATLVAELQQLEAQQTPTPENDEAAATKQKTLKQTREELAKWNAKAFAALPAEAQRIHERAFATNQADPHYRQLETATYTDDGTSRQMQVPKGDILHQFRQDVLENKLPTVSWVIPSERFSDHPDSAWYGAWFLSEVFDALTANPEVWKKTIFILCYDENDGYFDHVPPFMAPHPGHSGTGKVSPGIDAAVEQLTAAQQQDYDTHNPGISPDSIGLGYRVPLVVASPWSRGGYVCSQVFDQTSILQFLELFLSHKSGRSMRETNISQWRRTVCGDLTSVFRPYNGENIALPKPLDRAAVLDAINSAQYRPLPGDFKRLTAAEIAQAKENTGSITCMARQEPGTRPACALPYELAANGGLNAERKAFQIELSAGNSRFGKQSSGSPFRVYAPGNVRAVSGEFKPGRTWDYAVSAGDRLTDSWSLDDFADRAYHLHVQGPNGFHREFRGSASDPLLEAKLMPARDAGSSQAALALANRDSQKTFTVLVDDLGYGGERRTVQVKPGETSSLQLDLSASSGWHDVRIQVRDFPGFEQRFAGRIETGRESTSDPVMGKA